MIFLLTIISSIFVILTAVMLFSVLVKNQKINKRFSFQSLNPIPMISAKPYSGIIILVLVVGIVMSISFLSAAIQILLVLFITYLALNIVDKIFDKLEGIWTNTLINIGNGVILFFYTMITLSSIWSFHSYESISLLDHIIALVSTMIPLLILSVISRKNPGKPMFAKGQSSSKLSHYREQGLSDEEIKQFRQEMQSLRENIYVIDTEMNKAAKLRAIDLKYNTVNIAKQFFADIVCQPKRLPEVANLLYRTAPSLADITQKYNEVNEHIAKTKQTYLILEKSAQTIEALADSLENEYIQFHQATYNNLDDEIRFAQKNLKANDAWDQFEEGE